MIENRLGHSLAMFGCHSFSMTTIPWVFIAGLLSLLVYIIQPGTAMSTSQVAATLSDLNPVHRNVMIITRHHHCLDANKAQTKNGTKVQFSKCHGKAHQRWTLSKGGYLVSQHTRVRKCLSAPINLLHKGTALRLWDCQNVAGQRWFYKNGRLFLFHPKKGLCITTRSGGVERNGDAAVLGNCRARGGMTLKLASKMPLPLNPVQLKLQKSSLCIDKTSGLKNGVPVGLNACNRKAINQRFKLEKKRGDYIQIQSSHSGKCLGVADASKKHGAVIQQWSCLGYDNQLWKKIDRSRHVFALKAKHSGFCLTAFRIKKKKVANLLQQKCKGSNAAGQLFKMSR